MDTDETQFESTEQADTEFDLDLEVETETPADQVDWKAEALKYKSMAQRYKAKATTPAPKPKIINKETVDPKPKTYGIEDEVLDLRLDGYTKPEVEFIMKNGGRQALEDKTSYVAIALNTKREQEAAEHAASETTSGAGLSEIERKYTPEQLANMSIEELEKILPRA